MTNTDNRTARIERARVAYERLKRYMDDDSDFDEPEREVFSLAQAYAFLVDDAAVVSFAGSGLPPEPKIKHWRALLQTLATGLNQHDHIPVSGLDVHVHGSEGVVLRCSPQTLIDYIANDIYWNEDGDWSDATHVTVQVF